MRQQPGELIVIDNDPIDGQAKGIAWAYDASYHVEPVRGVPHARNLGLRATALAVVAYLDDDSVADGEWLQALARPFQDPAVGGVAGVVMRPIDPGSAVVPPLAERLSANQQVWTQEVALRRERNGWFRTINFGGFVRGGNMAIRRGAALQVGAFSPHLGRGAPIRGGDEQYMFFRLVRAGWTAVVTPEAHVLHPWPESVEGVVKYYLGAEESLAGYALFLLARHPRYAGWLLRRLAGAPARLMAGAAAHHGVGRFARVLAWGRGVGGAMKALIR
jgi:cellulose synthase/poly-beta-1,6-N-acetylglucosamine synthase-like glycosyltransferase